MGLQELVDRLRTVLRRVPSAPPTSNIEPVPLPFLVSELLQNYRTEVKPRLQSGDISGAAVHMEIIANLLAQRKNDLFAVRSGISMCVMANRVSQELSEGCYRPQENLAFEAYAVQTNMALQINGTNPSALS